MGPEQHKVQIRQMVDNIRVDRVSQLHQLEPKERLQLRDPKVNFQPSIPFIDSIRPVSE